MKAPTLGYALAVLGLAIAAVSLVPAWFDRDDFPWPLFIGSFVYLNGAFLAFFSAPRAEKKGAMLRLRYVRLGFVALVGVIVWRLVAG
jgi:hypothetical protein